MATVESTTVDRKEPYQKLDSIGERSSGRARKKCFGLLTRKERWGLSWSGWIVVALAVLVGSYWLFTSIYPFLATTHRVDTNVLVVEGWVHEYAIRAAVKEFRTGAYEAVVATGGPVEGSGGYTNDFNTSASVGADLLKKNGVPTGVLFMVPSRVMDRDRTYASAVALRAWLASQHVNVRGVNIVTENTHARRSQLLFKKALGEKMNVGTIAVDNPDYDPKRWWSYSAGVKDVVSEGFSYLYALFFVLFATE
jgi:uncharacterized SAM-binding protein YcdF (DUF218 family)